MRRQGMGRNQLGEEVGAGGGGAGRPTGAGLPVRLLWLLRLAGLLLRPGLARFGAAVRAELRGVANAARADARRERARRRGPSNGSPRPTSSSSHCTFFPALSYRPQETFLGSGPRPRDRRVRPPEELPRGYRREWPRRRPSRGETPRHFFPTGPPPRLTIANACGHRLKRSSTARAHIPVIPYWCGCSVDAVGGWHLCYIL